MLSLFSRRAMYIRIGHRAYLMGVAMVTGLINMQLRLRQLIRALESWSTTWSVTIGKFDVLVKFGCDSTHF